MKTAVPDIGWIVGCWFPDTDIEPYKRGQKFRPCIVLAVQYHLLKEHPIITVCYGTGQSSATNSKQRSHHWFEIAPDANKNSLTYTTRFYIDEIVSLPFTKEYFEPKWQTNRTFDFFGKLDVLQLGKVNAILKSMDEESSSKSSPTSASSPVSPPVITYKKMGKLTLLSAASQ